MILHYLISIRMTIQERIRKIAEELFEGNISAFCRAINVKQPTINTIIGDRQSKPSYDVLCNVLNAKALNISSDWLMLGKGEMLLSGSHFIKTEPTSNNDIKILDIRVCAGHGIGFDGNENKVVGYVNIPEFVGCYGITVFGDSMYNMYMPGDIIFVREIKGKDMIDNGQPYVVITTEDRLLKMVYAEEDGLKFVSYNTVCNPDGRRKYPDMKIEGSQILHLYKVVGKLARTQM